MCFLIYRGVERAGDNLGEEGQFGAYPMSLRHYSGLAAKRPNEPACLKNLLKFFSGCCFEFVFVLLLKQGLRMYPWMT